MIHLHQIISVEEFIPNQVSSEISSHCLFLSALDLRSVSILKPSIFLSSKIRSVAIIIVQVINTISQWRTLTLPSLHLLQELLHDNIFVVHFSCLKSFSHVNWGRGLVKVDIPGHIPHLLTMLLFLNPTIEKLWEIIGISIGFYCFHDFIKFGIFITQIPIVMNSHFVLHIGVVAIHYCQHPAHYTWGIILAFLFVQIYLLL